MCHMPIYKTKHKRIICTELVAVLSSMHDVKLCNAAALVLVTACTEQLGTLLCVLSFLC